MQSAQFITDANGEKYEHIEYTPYGELWIEETAPGVDKLPFRFTGKELDEETGLYYYGARYLDPKYSRWLSGDPAIGEYIPQAPINDQAKKHNENLPGMGGVFNVVNLHLYHYAGNNPVKYTDPDGRANTLSITPSDVELFLEETKQALSSIPTPAIVCVGIASGLIIANELSDGAVFEGIADGINFIADKTIEAGKWIGEKGKEFGTWLGGKAKSVWNGLLRSQQANERRSRNKIKNELESRLGRKLTKQEEEKWHREMDKYKKDKRTTDNKNPSLSDEELRDAAEDALGDNLNVDD